jgi:hypothetical protein
MNSPANEIDAINNFERFGELGPLRIIVWRRDQLNLRQSRAADEAQ